MPVFDALQFLLIVKDSLETMNHTLAPNHQFDYFKFCFIKCFSRFTNILAVPDPAMISIGGVLIGITSVDILMHLSKNELAQYVHLLHNNQLTKMFRVDL